MTHRANVDSTGNAPVAVLTRGHRDSLREWGGYAMYDAGIDRHDGREQAWDAVLRLIADLYLLDAIGWSDEDDHDGEKAVEVTPTLLGLLERLAHLSREAVEDEFHNREHDPDHEPSDRWVDKNLDVVSAYDLAAAAGER